MEELKEQQNRIEQKLDLILLVLARHPEFGNMVKEGKRKAYYEAKRKELVFQLEEWNSAKIRAMVRAVEENMAPDFRAAILALYPGFSSREEIAQCQQKIFSEAKENPGKYPMLATFLNKAIGPEPDIDSELNKLMLEYAKEQENI